MVKKLTTEEFVSKSKQKFGDTFNYEQTEYLTQKDKVSIECPVHGVFSILPWNHLKSPTGCQKCSKDNTYTKKEDYIQKAKEIRGEQFDYSQTHFVDWATPIKIICRKHGELEVNPKRHLYSKKSNGCPKCGVEGAVAKRSVGYEEFINKCVQKYGKKYKYDKESWQGLDADIKFICKSNANRQKFKRYNYTIFK